MVETIQRLRRTIEMFVQRSVDVAAQERLSVHMSWRCPACRTDVLHIVRHQLPDPSRTYRCQACRLNLRFSCLLRKMRIASFQSDHYAAATNTHAHSVSPVIPVKRTK